MERLIGCQSIFSAFERQLAFRRVDVLGFTILSAWILSPVGGQASLRLLATEPLIIPINDTLKYYQVHGYGNQSHLRNYKTTWPLYALLYTIALLTSTEYDESPMDRFGNIKVTSLPKYWDTLCAGTQTFLLHYKSLPHLCLELPVASTYFLRI
jgi:hypothetical protein